MSEKTTNTVDFDSDDPAEQELWSALAGLPRRAPSAGMRRSFYRKLERAAETRWPERVRGWLGLSGERGWLTVAACVLVGAGFGQTLNKTADVEPARLAALEENVAVLNRQLILDRLQDSTAGQRLRGVMDAERLVRDDLEIARALLLRATEDRVQSVRSAAIDALGPSMTSASVGREIMDLLENAESPLVQLALVDLVLRNGSSAQLQYLSQLANSGRLHPDLIRHVRNSLRGETV